MIELVLTVFLAGAVSFFVMTIMVIARWFVTRSLKNWRDGGDK